MIGMLEHWDLNKNAFLIQEKRFNLFDKIQSLVRPIDQAEYFISFTNVKDKLGINPKFDSGGTPIGVYGFPLTPEVFEDFKNESLPFGMERKYISIGRINLNGKKMGVMGGYNKDDTSFKSVYDDILGLLTLKDEESGNTDKEISEFERKTLKQICDFCIDLLNDINQEIKVEILHITKLMWNVIKESDNPYDISSRIQDIYEKQFTNIFLALDRIRNETSKKVSEFEQSIKSSGNLYEIMDISRIIRNLILLPTDMCNNAISDLKGFFRHFSILSPQKFNEGVKEYYSDDSNFKKFSESVYSHVSFQFIGLVKLLNIFKKFIDEPISPDSLAGFTSLFLPIIGSSKVSSVSQIDRSVGTRFTGLDPKTHISPKIANMPQIAVWKLSNNLANQIASNSISSLPTGEKIAVSWAKNLMKLGYGAFIDYGSSVIHTAEPTQILLFPGSYEYIGQFENDFFRSKETRQHWASKFKNDPLDYIYIKNTSIGSDIFLQEPFNGNVKSRIYLQNAEIRFNSDVIFKNLILLDDSKIILNNNTLSANRIEVAKSSIVFNGGQLDTEQIRICPSNYSDIIISCKNHEDQVEALIPKMIIDKRNLPYDLRFDLNGKGDDIEVITEIAKSFNLSDSKKINNILFKEIFGIDIDYYILRAQSN